MEKRGKYYSGTLRIFVVTIGMALAGCTATGYEWPDDHVIRLGARNATRAVNTLEDLADVGDNVGIYAMDTGLETPATPAGGTHWETTPRMTNVRTEAIDPVTGVISWSEIYYYPTLSTEYVEFCAYHPYGAVGATDQPFYLEAPATGQAPRLHFTLSGSEDLMCATPVFGSRNNPPATLEFRHLLTQLRFQLVDEYGSLADANLLAITLCDANRSAAMDIESGAVGGWGNPGEIPVPEISETPITGSPAAPQPVGGEVMLQPGTDVFTLRVETSEGTYEKVDIRPTSSIDGIPETSFAAGRSYLVTLTFRKLTGITATASVVPWQTAGSAEVVIQ